MVSSPVRLSKADARRALVSYQFRPCATQAEAFERLRSVQFDPIAPVGCNHDLVLQARVPGYQIGDWEKLAYDDRTIYDGWDKQASLVPFEGWPWRRYFHDRQRQNYRKLLEEYAPVIPALLAEIRDRGPLMPRECSFQERRPEWKSSWYGASVTQKLLRILWHTGEIMTVARRNGQHVYDLTPRVVPSHLFELPRLDPQAELVELARDRHLSLGILRPTASYEVWSYLYAGPRAEATRPLLEAGEIVPVEVEGLRANATLEFLAQLDEPPLAPRVRFIAPLDQLLWDRKLVAHLFEFDYVWEIYTPEAKRRWGYYVLPVLYGDTLVARAEFFAREGVLELRRWLDEPGIDRGTFFEALEVALRDFMAYSRSTEIRVDASVPGEIRDVAARASR